MLSTLPLAAFEATMPTPSPSSSSSPSPPPLGRTAVRPAWQTLPEPVRHAVAEQLPAPIASVADQGGGFTPGIAAQLRLADGTAVFVKAVPATHPLAEVYRHEGHTAARLPLATPAPRLRWTATTGAWVVLVFDNVDGRHPDLTPGSADISRVVNAVAAMSEALTPCPILDVEPSSTARGDWLHGWDLIAGQVPADLGAWERRHLNDLIKAETLWRAHANGSTLVHGDIRPDNLLVTVDGTVAVVDWARASRGASWQDVADLVPHLIMAGHTPAAAESCLAETPAWQKTGVEVLTSYAVAYAGYWTGMSRQPAPEGVPHLRSYQRHAATAAIAWVRHRADATSPVA
ncbi:aminoglycoside phosphotransferase family protein [Nonomuraea turkmeniaca]|uniref:Aminoglycoside phosphotransferase family protein n=1 Tax=Nonomuraea turkmeniaca TaxID=103838 RepID=A0A5S4EYD0_9ACTN|nr:phosphotransferase [Nonomuraea turkmeniaca]TMR08721.1 aminoglycoside phosphotransferase family protein [Nonomuraea turkmeniaca]